uniref:Uncharacterized protein n=1 Tax=Arundo donax TaxID=35708 RepID=A0A0A9ATD7_ARUDO
MTLSLKIRARPSKQTHQLTNLSQSLPGTG